MMRYLLLYSICMLMLAGCGTKGPATIPAAVTLPKLTQGHYQQKVDIPTVGTVRYTIEVPFDYDGSKPVPLVVLLHYGYEGMKPSAYTGGQLMDLYRDGLSSLEAIVIAPDAVGGDWTWAKNEKAVVCLTKSIMETYSIDKKKVLLTGYSMGGEGTWFIGSRHQDVFTGAIPVAAPVAGENSNWRIPIYVIHSEDDQIVSFSAAKKHADTVKSKAPALEFKAIQGLTHYDTGEYESHLGVGITWLEQQWK